MVLDETREEKKDKNLVFIFFYWFFNYFLISSFSVIFPN